eukprot:365166-Chlamydomonas_euryale.AAC.2
MQAGRQPLGASCLFDKRLTVSLGYEQGTQLRCALCAGVCWNKKNKRWQAAINSSGKYLYLGSYDTQGAMAGRNQ